MGYQPEPAPETVEENLLETHAFTPNTETFQQSFESPNVTQIVTQAEFVPETNLPPMRSSTTADWKRCPICNAGIAQYRDVCSRCATVKPVKQKSGLGKFVYVLLILGLFGGGIYYFINSSTPAILRKFAKATGSNGSIAADSFVIKGSSKIAVQQVMSAQNIYSGRSPVRREESYLFEFSHKNPNKIFMDFYKMNGSSRESAMSQGYNGTSGWKYTSIFDQPAKMENSGNDFGDEKIGFGLDGNQSFIELNETTKEGFDHAMTYFKESVKTFEVEGTTKNSNNKVFLLSKKINTDGTEQKILFVFDDESGFLIGMLKYGTINNTPVTNTFLFDKYKKFWLKEKGLFGTSNKFVSIPTVFIFKMEDQLVSDKGGVNMQISLEIDSITMDAPIDDAIFEKPAK